jgi:hypothetical protein
MQLLDHLIGMDPIQAVLERLGDQDAIERIAMQWR